MDSMSMYHVSPLHISPAITRQSKRSRSSGECEAVRGTPRPSLSIDGSYCSPTPPLSAGSSASSSSNGSLSSFPLSFSSLAWSTDCVGPPMVVSQSPDFYSPPQAGFGIDCRQNATAQYGCKKLETGFSVEPLAPGSMLPPKRPSSDVSVEVVPSIGVPAAPILHDHQLDFNPSSDPLTPWEHQQFIEGLIGVSMVAIESIWPNQVKPAECRPDCRPPSPSDSKVLPLHYFVKETLRRSRSSAAVLQTALYYLHKARSKIRARVGYAEQAKERFTRMAKMRQQCSAAPFSTASEEFTSAAAEVLATSKDPVICGRRMFLASLIAASKFLQDRTYSNRAWSRLSGLTVQEVNSNERAFLEVLEYKLFIKSELYQNWTARLRKLQEQQDQPLSERVPINRSTSEYVPPPLQTDAVQPPRVPCSTSPDSPARFKHSSAPTAPLGRSYSEREQPQSSWLSSPLAALSASNTGIMERMPVKFDMAALSPLARSCSSRQKPSASPLRHSFAMQRRISLDGGCRPAASRLPSWSGSKKLAPVY